MRSWLVSGDEVAIASTHNEGPRKRQRQDQDYLQLLTPNESTHAQGPQHLEDAPCVRGPDSLETSPYQSSAQGWNIQTLPDPVHDLPPEDAGLFDAMFGEAMDSYGNHSLALAGEFYAAKTLPENQEILTIPSLSSYSQSSRNESPPDESSPAGRQVTQVGVVADKVADTTTGSGSPTQRLDKDTPLQQLARLDYNLITLLDHIGKGRPYVSMDTLVSPVDEAKSSTPAVDDILNRTREFIDVLKLLSEKHSASSSSASTASASSSSSSPPSPHHIQSNRPQARPHLAAFDEDANADSPADSAFSSSLTPPRTSDVGAYQVLDTGSLIAVLSSYIRVLRLHLIIFAHIHDYLKELSESDEPVLCPVPGLSFCTFPIRKLPHHNRSGAQILIICLESGNLQTLILIQVVTSLFERMEVLLGFPREFRMSTRKEEPHGLFAQLGFMDIAGPIMRKEDEGDVHCGQGGVKCLRKYIKKTKKLLRDRIAP